MKISIICHDLSLNSFGRAHLLGELLLAYYEVEIVGPTFGKGVWEPLISTKIPYRTFKVDSYVDFLNKARHLLQLVSGDVIYVSKLKPHSIYLGLIARLLKKLPLVVDVDDWELGFVGQMPVYRKILSFGHLFTKHDGFANHFISEKLIRFADQITVSNEFLLNRFGGTLINHCRDTRLLEPSKYNSEVLKSEFNMHNKVVISFIGTPQPHKGLEDLIEAISIIKNERILLLLVGLDDSKYCGSLKHKALGELGADKVQFFGLQSFDTLPKFLAISDIVVIPQKKNLATVGQMPAKVFDAMAMAKPIIATDVSDFSKVLEGCGWIVEPNSPKILAQAIEYVVTHPLEAKQKACKAREKCELEFSMEVTRKRIHEVFRRYEK